MRKIRKDMEMGKIMRLKALPALMVCAALLNSCIRDRFDAAPDVENENVTFKISVPAPARQGTRALEAADEYAVQDVSVLAFDATGKTLRGRYSGRIVSGPTPSGGSAATVTFEVSLPKGQFDIMLVANGKQILAAKSSALAEGSSQASVEAALTMDMTTDGWNTATGSADYYGIPMWGYIKSVTVPSDSSIGTIHLTRMIAKVDVLLGALVTPDNFKLQNVRVYNYVEQGRLIPDTDNPLFDWTAVTQANLAGNRTPSLPSPYTKANPAAPDNEFLAYTVGSSNNSLTNSIYLFESPAGVAPADGAFVGNTCLVVGGSYKNGGTTWYRIDFAKPTDATMTVYDYLPILRNNQYIITIAGVTAAGYGSPEEALANPPANMTVRFIDWTNPEIRILVTNGVYLLGVSDDSFTFSEDAHTASDTDNFLKVVTDWPYGWTAEVWGNEAGTVALTGNWLRLSVASGNGNYPNGNPVQLILDANTGGERTAYIHIKAGVLNYIIKVTQQFKPLGESNCYMIDNANPRTLEIPISQVGYAMGNSENPANGFLPSNWITDFTKLKAQVLWTDLGNETDGKFGTPDAVVLSTEYNGATNLSDGKIIVVPGSGTGNAGIILYEDNDGTPGYQYVDPNVWTPDKDKIIWSWHIWKSDYYPYNADGTPNGKKTGNLSLTNTNWMDRNLGAKSNAFVSPISAIQTSIGFVYQWGRKDPFPGSSVLTDHNLLSQKFYYPSASLAFFDETTTTPTPSETNLTNSVQNPMTRHLYGSPTYDWFTTTVENQNQDLWGGVGGSAFLHSNGKSVYDPCPEGYRVPRSDGKENLDSWGNTTTWDGFAGQGNNNASYGGYYPLAGRRSANSAGVGFVGQNGYYWSATSYTVDFKRYDSFCLWLGYTGVVNPSVGNNHLRAYGYSVRCRAE